MIYIQDQFTVNQLYLQDISVTAIPDFAFEELLQEGF